MQKSNLQKNPLKETQNPLRYYNSIITNLKFQHTSQNIIFQKPSYKNRNLLLIRGQNSLSYYTLQ